MLLLEQYDSCALWLESFKTTATKRNCMIHLSMFCKFANITPDDLIAMSTDQTKQEILKYIMHLKKNAVQKPTKAMAGQININSVATYIVGVRSFLDFHDKPINWKKIKNYLPDRNTTILRAYTRDEIQKLLSFADIRMRAVILIMVSGGPRVGAFPDLKISNFSIIDEQVNIGMLKVYASSQKDRYVTLLTPECTRAIQEYLEWRRKNGENGQEPLLPNAPLIRDKFDIVTSRRGKPQALQAHTVYVGVRRLLKKTGLESPELQPDHSFRYFFDTALMNSDVTDKFKELLMGHSIDLDDVYYDARTTQSRQKILFEYMKAVDALTINDEYRLRKEVAILQEKVKDAPKLEILQDALLTEKMNTERLMKREVEKELEIDALKEQRKKDKEEMDKRLEAVTRQNEIIIEALKNDPQMRERMLKNTVPKESRDLPQ